MSNQFQLEDLPHSLVAAAKLIISIWGKESAGLPLNILLIGYEAGVQDTNFENTMKGMLK